MRVWIALAAIGLATGAGAECAVEEAGLGERHEALAEERGTLTAPARSSLSTLRRTAEQLDRNGHETACDEVVDTASRLLEDEAVWTDRPTPPDPTDKMNLVTFAATEGPLESTDLVGRPLKGREGGLLGIVDGVLLDQTRDASHLVVRREGVWDGASLITVPSERILIDPGTGELFAEIGAGRMAEAPRYDRESWDVALNDRWYDDEAAKAVDQAEARAMEARTAEQQASDTAMSGEGTATAATERPAAEDQTADAAKRGPKRIRIEKDRPETAEGSSD